MAPLSPDPLVGRLFDQRYEVIARIGEGGFGAVYRARQIAMDRSVALKVIHPDQQADDTVVKRFFREMQTTSRMAHPNTVRVYDFGTTPEGDVFLAMELLDGESLAARLERIGALDLDTAVKVAVQMLKALSAAHTEQIVHRDLKPENVMLCTVYGEADQVRVLDFGLAIFAPGSENPSARITASGILICSPSYASPEQISGEEVDHRADLYSFGVVFYEMLVGRRPFVDEKRPLRVLQMHMTETPKPASTVATQVIPPWVDQLLMRLLAKYPADRPASADAVIAVLEARGRSPTPMPVLERPPSVLADGPGARLIGAVVLAVALAFGLGGVLFGLFLSA